jgi:glycosyltransferase involved in cell wall biosynthesis
LPALVRQQFDSAEDALRLLFVSHYNYYRNFETLFRAIAVLRDRLRTKRIRLFLTCQLRSDANSGSYRAEKAAALVEQLGIGDEVVELGAIPYSLLHQVYRACDLYVAHPLVEAMASGLPVVASDLPVHREICGSGALYFERFSPQDLCAQVLRTVASSDLRQELSHSGRIRSVAFSWAKHVDELLVLATELVPARRTFKAPVIT